MSNSNFRLLKGDFKVNLLISPRKKSFFREYGYLALCALIPAMLCYLMYLVYGVHPFGDGSVLVLDLNGQYVWFFEALRNFAKGDASLLYSFARAMGGEFVGIYAYYLASPLSFIVCLFPLDRMLEGLLLLFLIKTALCGLTFGYYMHKTSAERRPYAILIFSICYALCSYGIVQQHNTMWIDAMMWLPLITLGIESLIKHGKFKLYTFFLAITLFSNFYIGYMVCIYCFFYFFIYYVGQGKGKENNPHGERIHFVKSLLRMAFYSVLAVGIAAIILLCAYYSLNFGKSTFSETNWDWNFNLNVFDLMYKFLPGSYDTVRPEGHPFIYCGILTLLLLPAYFISKKFSIRQKITSAIFVAIFISSFSLSVLDLIWHGFQRPNWLNYRYSFMLCFYLCVLACRVLLTFESYYLYAVIGTGGALAAVCLLLGKYTDGEFVKPDQLTCIWFSILALLLYLSILGLRQVVKSKTAVCILLTIVVCAEVFVNGLCSMYSLNKDVVYTRYSTYNNYLADVRPIVDMVQDSDDSFYRMEKTMFRKINDNMALKMRGLSGSTSTLNQETIMFLQKMGYASESHWSKYLGGTPVSDSILGIKYIIADEYFNELEQYYSLYASTDKYRAYLNSYALSIAYGVSDDLLDFNLGYLPLIEEDAKETDKPKEEKPNANEIGDAISKGKAWINQLLGIDETIRSAEYADDYNSPFERLNAMITAMLGEKEMIKVFVPVSDVTVTSKGLDDPYFAEDHICYTFEEGDETKHSLTYSFFMPEDAELFYYMPTNYPRELSLALYNMKSKESKSCGSFGGHETFRIVSLGLQEEGTRLSVRATTKGNGLYYFFDQPCLYYIDKAVFEDVMGRLAQDQLIVTDHTEDSIKGTFTASRSKELVMTTLAYDQGWQILVDGKKVEPIKALGSVISFYVEGEVGQTHNIELAYRPNVLVVGGIVSGVSLITYLTLAILEPKLKKIPLLRSVVSVPQREEEKKKSLRRKKD